MDATVLDIKTEVENTGSALPNVEPISCQTSRAISRKKLSFPKRCLFSLIPVVTLLLTVEVMARCVLQNPTELRRFAQIEQIIVYLGNQPGQSIFEPDPDCFWRLKPHAKLPDDGGSKWGGVMSNSHGMRSRELTVAETQDRVRVLCFGDSSTFAFGVNIDDAWPNQLQTLLDAEKPGAVEVLNAGIPGQTSYQGRMRLTRELTKWRPHLAMITFGNNDGWRWDGLEDKEHAHRTQAAHKPSILQYSRALDWLVSVRQKSQQVAMTQQQLAWARDATLNYFDPNAEWTPRVSLADFADNLRAMVEECRRFDCEPVLIVWPDQRQLLDQSTWRIPYQAAMRQVADETGSACLDLVEPFEREKEWAVQRFIPNDVIHLDPAGNRFVSDLVAPYVRDLGANTATKPEP